MFLSAAQALSTISGRVRPLERDDRARAAKLAALGERLRLSELEERAIDLRVIRDEPR